MSTRPTPVSPVRTAAWTDDECDEFAALLDDVLAGASSSSDRVDLRAWLTAATERRPA